MLVREAGDGLRLRGVEWLVGGAGDRRRRLVIEASDDVPTGDEVGAPADQRDRPLVGISEDLPAYDLRRPDT